MAFVDDLQDAVKSAACFTLSGVGDANRWLQSVFSDGPNPPSEGGLRGLLCDDPTPPPQTPPPFAGGQCAGVSYRVFRQSSSPSVSEQQVTNPSTYPGPISPTFTKTDDQDRQFRCFTYGANRTEKCFQGSAPGAELDPALSITRVERVDGNPDDCGDPAPIIPPYEPPVIVVPVPNPDGGPDIDVDVTLFAPIIVGPNVFAPVRIQGPNFDIDGQLVLSPNVEVNLGLGGTGGTGGGTGVQPNPGEDFDPESPDEPPAADGRRIIGLIVTLDIGLETTATELTQDGDVGSIHVPRAAIAYLVSNNGGVRVPLSGIDLKLRNTYIPVPPDVEVVSWRIHTEKDVAVQSVRPVYGSTRPAN